MKLGRALQRYLCVTRAHVGVVYGQWRRCDLDFSSGGAAAFASYPRILVWGGRVIAL